MRKTHLFFCLLISLSSIAQVKISPREENGSRSIIDAPTFDSLDACVLRAQYRMEYVKDTKKPSKKSHNFMILQVGKKISKFSDFLLLKADSLHADFAKKKASFSEASGTMMSYYTGSLAINVFKNYPTGKITVFDRAFLAGNFKYTEDLTKFDWKLEPGDSAVCGYKCKKATTTFRGRNYTAWYAPQITYSDGPWKFRGLPGLILKVTDDTKEYSFECVAIEKARKGEFLYMKQSECFNTTRERFNITVKNAFDNPNPYVESVGAQPIPNKKLPYNPIELE